MWEVCAGVVLVTLTKVISDHIGHEWKRLARTLNMTQTDIDAIEYKDKFSLKEQIYQFFHQWEQKNGHDATPRVLIDAIEKSCMDSILQLLEKEHLIEKSGIGHPVQETPVAFARPKLKVRRESDLDDVEADDGRNESVAALKPVATSPEDKERQRIRTKRLARLKSDQTGHGPFEDGDMVMVDKIGYGVVKWIGQLSMKSQGSRGASDKLIAGIEFENQVPGGISGEYDGYSYFKCDAGHGLLLPYDRLKRDDRFSDEPAPPRSEEPKPSPPAGHLVLAGHSPATTTASEDVLFKQYFEALGTNGSESGECKLPGCSKPRFQDNGQSFDFCGKLHAQLFKELQVPESLPKRLEFYIPNDHAGLVIGREGKNIREVEHATGTIIKLDNGPQFGGRRKGTITGSEENCKKAVVLISQKLQHRVSMHTATSDTMKVPESMVGKIIGKGGATIEFIKSLSGAHDIKLEKPSALEAVFSPDRECTITGSREQIDDAKRLIHQVIAGEDIVTNARIAAIMAKLQIGMEDEGSSGCTVM